MVSNTWTAANRDKFPRTALSVKHTMSGGDRVKAFADNIREIANIQRINTLMQLKHLYKATNHRMNLVLNYGD